ncbi:hypothetical protein AYO37_01075 [Opitutia bacterium SCGC AG-212-L18]|nr:hypothetical protein AYO37_01075 [Opitutae bacterium SCGC AG-212-L18]
MLKNTNRNIFLKSPDRKRSSLYQKAIEYVSKHYFISPNDLKCKNIFRQYVEKLQSDGYIEKYYDGTYVSKFFKEEPAFASFIYTCKRIPKGVICLLSALEYHDITTQVPYQIWVCTPYNFIEPKNFPYALSVTRASEEALKVGVIEEKVAGNWIRVFNAAKTVTDCFKFRNKIGINIAIEALRDGLAKKKFSLNELHQYAKLNRVDKVMKPYIEGITNE